MPGVATLASRTRDFVNHVATKILWLFCFSDGKAVFICLVVKMTEILAIFRKRLEKTSLLFAPILHKKKYPFLGRFFCCLGICVLFHVCNIRLLQSHMRLKKNRPYNHWLKSQGHYLLCFSTSNQSEPIRFVCDMRLRPVTA